MSQHYTRSTVSAAAWCNKCRKQTQHQVCDRRLGACLDCMERAEQDHLTPKPLTRKPEKARQAELFAADSHRPGVGDRL